MTIDEIIERRFRRDMSPPFDPTAWYVVAAKDAVREVIRGPVIDRIDEVIRHWSYFDERQIYTALRALAATVEPDTQWSNDDVSVEPNLPLVDDDGEKS